MGILATLAQSDFNNYYQTTSNGTGDDAAAVAILVTFGLVFILFTIAIYIVTALCLMRIFKKAGVKPWIAWVPVYNSWKLLEIGGQPGFWSVLAFIPIVNIVSSVYLYIAMYNIGLKLGKDGVYVVIAIFITPVWFILLALDKSVWNDTAGAPSLAPETANAPKQPV